MPSHGPFTTLSQECSPTAAYTVGLSPPASPPSIPFSSYSTGNPYSHHASSCAVICQHVSRRPTFPLHREELSEP